MILLRVALLHMGLLHAALPHVALLLENSHTCQWYLHTMPLTHTYSQHHTASMYTVSHSYTPMASAHDTGTRVHAATSTCSWQAIYVGAA
jgi:hypothetical protein